MRFHDLDEKQVQAFDQWVSRTIDTGAYERDIVKLTDAEFDRHQTVTRCSCCGAKIADPPEHVSGRCWDCLVTRWFRARTTVAPWRKR